ncbi:Heterokaryon incompatibility, partial [Metarhizium majus ARSEF 297]
MHQAATRQMNPQLGPCPVTNDDEDNFSSLYNSLRLPYGSRKIRIFHVLAESCSNINRLDIQLRVMDLQHRPRFCALSYAWGSPTAASHKVHCGNHVIGVTPNLWSALWHLRKVYGAALPPLWIDRVCIDQDNEDEKTAQLQLMHHIFSEAQFVFIWLGEGTSASDRGIESLSKTGLQSYLVQDEGGLVQASCSSWTLRRLENCAPGFRDYTCAGSISSVPFPLLATLRRGTSTSSP